MIPRPQYINTLRTFRDIQLVKILAGVRRSGKSTILEMLRNDLISNGIAADHIVSVRYTSEFVASGQTHRDMFMQIFKQITDEDRYYLLLDEVQEVEEWERAVNSLLEDANTDIYVTGSNSRLMASEISTYLTGRYVLIPVYTLSFAEYLEFKGADSKHCRDALEEYIHRGGFPLLATITNCDDQTARQIVEGIYLSVVSRDITKRNQVKNLDLFNRTVLYIVENMGKTFSARAIANFLKSEGRSLSVESIYNYLAWMEKAFLIYRCSRYDLQGKSVLKTQEKFYLTDPSIRYGLMGFDDKSLPAILENIVYLELRRRGYKVYIGKNQEKEIDFVAVLRGDCIYVQVCVKLPMESDREVANLLEIRDHYHKYVVTMDSLAGGNFSGVKVMHLADFLLFQGDL